MQNWVRKICWRRDRLPTPVFLGFPGGSDGKESTCNVGDLGSVPGLGRSPGGGNSYPLQYSGLESSMDCIVHGVAKSRTWLSNFQFCINKMRYPSWPPHCTLHVSRGSSQPRDWTQLSHIAGRFFTSWATSKAQEYWSGQPTPSPAGLPNPGIEPASPAWQESSFLISLTNTYW